MPTSCWCLSSVQLERPISLLLWHKSDHGSRARGLHLGLMSNSYSSILWITCCRRQRCAAVKISRTSTADQWKPLKGSRLTFDDHYRYIIPTGAKGRAKKNVVASSERRILDLFYITWYNQKKNSPKHQVKRDAAKLVRRMPVTWHPTLRSSTTSVSSCRSSTPPSTAWVPSTSSLLWPGRGRGRRRTSWPPGTVVLTHSMFPPLMSTSLVSKNCLFHCWCVQGEGAAEFSVSDGKMFHLIISIWCIMHKLSHLYFFFYVGQFHSEMN